MNQGESQAFFTILKAFMALRDCPCPSTARNVCTDEVCAALISLADRASKGAGGGPNGDTIRNLWPKAPSWTLNRNLTTDGPHARPPSKAD